MTASDQVVCAECGCPFVRKPGRGRPARYCGSVCRRAAEYELRRVQGLLRRSQQKEQDAALAVALAVRFGKDEATRKLEFWKGETERLRTELRRLLATDLGPQESAQWLRPAQMR